MSGHRAPDLDLAIRSWLEEAAAPRRVDYLGDVLEQTRHARQRPAWTFPRRWLPQISVGRPLGLSSTTWLVLAVAVALALVTGLLAVGSLRRLPAPFGLARPGLVAWDLDNRIVVMNVDGSGRQELTQGAVDTSPVWSPDGTRLAFWRATGNGHWTIAITDQSGVVRATAIIDAHTDLPLPSGDPGWSGLQYPLGAPSFLEWSPDSQSIAFSQDVRGTPRVFVLGADGSGPRQVGDPSLTAMHPVWSSDGTRIAFRGWDPLGGNSGVWIMNADGTSAHRVSAVLGRGESFSHPQWQPGGELIAFIASPERSMHIYVVRSDGTGERDVSAPRPDDGTSDWIPRWSPDGTRIAYKHTDDERPDGEIRITDADGSHTVTPPGQPDASIGGPLWSPDGRMVAALLHGPTAAVGFVSLDLASGGAPIVVSASGNQGGTSWQRLAP